MTNRRNEYAKHERNILVLQFGGKCVFCGSTKNLEFAHVQPTLLNGRGRGRKERYADIKKHPNSYRLMCGDNINSCHVLFDKGLLKL